jgi:hypothetical protein
MNGGPGAVSGSPSEAPGGAGTPEQGSGTGTVHQRRWPLVSSLEFGALATAVPCADAELIVSELTTNALKASQSLPETQPFTLCLRSDYTHLIIEVWDHSPYDLRSALSGGDAEGGRGLLVVEALSARWGSQRIGYATKVVWAEFTTQSG